MNNWTKEIRSQVEDYKRSRESLEQTAEMVKSGMLTLIMERIVSLSEEPVIDKDLVTMFLPCYVKVGGHFARLVSYDPNDIVLEGVDDTHAGYDFNTFEDVEGLFNTLDSLGFFNEGVKTFADINIGFEYIKI